METNIFKQERYLLGFTYSSNETEGWTLGYHNGSFNFKRNSVEGGLNNELLLTASTTPELPAGDAYIPNKFYFLTDENNQHQCVATSEGMPPVYFSTEDNRPQVSIEGDVHYLPWRFAKVGDIVFNTEPKPGDDTPAKKGYIGYMCVQDGIPEIENGYVKFVDPPANTIPKMVGEGALWKCFGKILTVLLFCLLLQNTYAQGFLRTYLYEQLSNDYIKGIFQYPDSTYFASVANDTLQIWFLDKEGYVMSKRNMQTPANTSSDGGSLIPTADGNYIMTGWQYISKINPQGDSIWYKSADPGGIKIIPNNNLVQSLTSYPLCYGEDYIAAYGLKVFSPDGNLTNYTSLPAPIAGQTGCWRTVVHGSVADNDYALIVGTRYQSDSFYGIFVDVAKISLTNFGEVLWRNTEQTGVAFDIATLPDSSYLVATATSSGVLSWFDNFGDSLRIIKYLTNGTIAWQKTIDLDYPPYSRIQAVRFLKSEDGNEFILSANNVDRIVAIDSAANVLWLKKPPLYSIFDSIYNINYYDNARVVYQDGDNYLVSGLFSTLDNHYIPFLARLDSSGNCTPKANFGLVQQDSLLTLTNTSFGADSYQWLWGNGAGLQDTIKQSTQYIYPQTGIYHVCLVAHNLCGNDTICQTINYGVADGLHNALPTTPFSIANNPISAPTIQLIHPPLPTAATATVCNLNGQILLQQTLSVAQANSHINIALLPAGIYLLQIKGQNIWWQQKVVVVK